MRATIKGMSKYTTQELYDYEGRMQDRYEKASPWVKRHSMSGWPAAAAAICAEIQRRMLDGRDERQHIK